MAASPIIIRSNKLGFLVFKAWTLGFWGIYALWPFDLLFLLRRTVSRSGPTPSPPALRAPLSPKGARANDSLVFNSIVNLDTSVAGTAIAQAKWHGHSHL